MSRRKNSSSEHSNYVGHSDGIVVQHGGDVSGDVTNVVISGHTGPVHLGKGRIVTHDSGSINEFTGSGVTFISGDHEGPIVRTFGGKSKSKKKG